MSHNLVASIGMKLHTSEGEDGVRVTEFWTDANQGYQIAVTNDAMQDEPKLSSVVLNRREAEALRHWLDAVLTGTPAVGRYESDRILEPRTLVR